MWIGDIPYERLRERSCWKVEFFCGEAAVLANSPFESVALGELVDERRESMDPQTTPAQQLNYLGLEHVESLTGRLVDFAPVLGKEIRSRSKVFHPGDVLYGRLRPYLNKVYIAGAPVAEGICSGEFYVLIPKQLRILPHFLRAMLASEFVHPHVSRWQTGSALPRLQLHDLLDLSIPLPPMEIQERYEQFLIAQQNRYVQLMSEVVILPQQIMASLSESLGSGSPEIALIDV